jgi:hypothetical protein
MVINRKRNSTSLFSGLVLIAILLGACSPASPTLNAPDATADVGAIHTQAVQTVSAQQTLVAGENAVAQLTQQAAQPTQGAPATQGVPATPTTAAVLPSDTPPPTDTPAAPTPTAVPPTATPVPPTPTAVPPTAVPQPCDWAEYTGDVTVKDGTTFSPQKEFTKTWRIKNIGTCSWTADYDLVFVSGNRMEASKAIALDDRVKPGQTAELSVDLVAPSDPGDYTGRWMLRNADGELFGIGANRDKPFWVTIKVVRPNKLVWDLTKDACLAHWSTGALDGLACPDLSENTQIGFINLHPNPRLETGSTDDEPALVTMPNPADKGFVKGVFPAYKVKEGDHFRAVIGCLYGAKKCKVNFQLSYRLKNGKVTTLETWSEKYDESFQKIDVDLSELAGKSVELILTVTNRGDSTDDRAFWLQPSIWR